MKKLFTLFVAALAAMSMFADTWTVAGVNAILNGSASWAPAEELNDMTSTDDVNYTLTVTEKTLESGTVYEYKVVKNHAWDECYGNNGSNATLTVAETGVYTIVFSFNADTKVVGAVATKTDAAGEITHVYSVAGRNADLFGSVWSEINTATEMTLNADGLYEFSKSSVALSENVEFKVVEDHAWGVTYPSSNYVLAIAQAGTYDVVITFNASTKAVNATATLIEAAQPELPSALYMLVDNNSWTPAAMNKISDGVFFLGRVAFDKDGGNNYFAFTSVASNSDWDVVNANRWGGNSETLEVAPRDTTTATLRKASDACFVVGNGTYDITVDLNNMEISISETVYDFYMIGSSVLFGEAGTKMTDKKDGTYMLKVVKTLAAGNYLYNVEARVESNGQLENMNSSTEVLNAPKRVAQTPTAAKSFTLVEEREYTIRFDYDSETATLTATDESTGWATALDNAAGVQIEKLVRDGQVVIIKNGVEYNVLGARL